MALQGTLERGFSLHEAPEEDNEKAKKYQEFKVDYRHEQSRLKRYMPSFKHLIPIRTEKW